LPTRGPSVRRAHPVGTSQLSQPWGGSGDQRRLGIAPGAVRRSTLLVPADQTKGRYSTSRAFQLIHRSRGAVRGNEGSGHVAQPSDAPMRVAPAYSAAAACASIAASRWAPQAVLSAGRGTESSDLSRRPCCFTSRTGPAYALPLPTPFGGALSPRLPVPPVPLTPALVSTTDSDAPGDAPRRPSHTAMAAAPRSVVAAAEAAAAKGRPLPPAPPPRGRRSRGEQPAGRTRRR